jgi:hypothetical protein
LGIDGDAMGIRAIDGYGTVSKLGTDGQAQKLS